jgi:hypothetical protein
MIESIVTEIHARMAQQLVPITQRGNSGIRAQINLGDDARVPISGNPICKRMAQSNAGCGAGPAARTTGASH